ncbi:helix-turn-helix domain-containing protein [Tropicibacter naphthalenivorans]|uniref:Adenosine deaminase n=1 Tax=Tropicibacter naphthalenivorans TaxID=441103 RepID=A0A0P1G125_9RHOB|nr:AraC family transcriptional regulator [Tropicibacter naphthalenivorans]CUH75405.1 Adenosine deaminase [Tropicibacter naphthalenivorans]SMC44632.1 AraC-type DNA-binding protein [Tropicibacter naphthalenivorans]
MSVYDPKGNGKDRAVEQVQFIEAAPPEHLRAVVHRFLDLRTDGALAQDYRFHALPDACTYVVFDQIAPEVCGVTRLRASSEELNLGRAFHFTNIRFLPGVWQGAYGLGQVGAAYEGALPLRAVNARMAGLSFEDKQAVLAEFVDTLVAQGLVVANPVTERIFARIDDIFSVADMAEVAGLSPRQLQRVLKSTTGFSPHDFFKILRLQQSLGGEPSLSYADQSHFIRSFRQATGYTPGQYARKFDV